MTRALPWAGTVAALLAIIFVNPVREMTLEDDWVYSLMVKSLVETGQYTLHPYAAANLPFQTYWGAIASWIFGYSFTTIRLSVIAASALGAWAFYQLCREQDLDHHRSLVATSLLVASPLVFRFSLTFMTDEFLMAWVVIALLFYTRGLRRGSYAEMAIGALAAAGAVLTKQTGAAVVAGLALWWLVNRARGSRLPLVLVGGVLPAAAAAWQVLSIGLYPNFIANRALDLQDQFMSTARVYFTVANRPVLILYYLAFFLLPLTIVAGALAITNRRQRTFQALTLILGVAFVALGVGSLATPIGRLDPALATRLAAGGLTFLAASWGLGGWLAPGRDAHTDVLGRDSIWGGLLALFFLGVTLAFAVFRGSLMPYMGFNFEALRDDWQGQWPFAAPVVTMFSACGAVLIMQMMARRVRAWRDLTDHQRLLDCVALLSLASLVPFWFFGDEYLLPLVPYAIIVGMRALGPAFERARVQRTLVGLTAAWIVIWALDTRGILEGDEAMWKGGDAARRLSGDVHRVYHVDTTNTYRYWRLYNSRFFHELLDESGYYLEPTPAKATAVYQVSYSKKETAWAEAADYWVTKTPSPADWSQSILGPPTQWEWTVVETIPFQDWRLATRHVYVMKRGNRR